MRIAIAVVVVTTTAYADDFVSEKVGDYTIDASGNVTKGAIKAPLIDGKELSIHSFVGDAKAKRVSFGATAFCSGMGDGDYKFTFDQLEARIVNVSSLKLHLAKKYKDAAAGFERAAKLDPAWNIPAYNLASAHNLAGDRAGALAALAPMLVAKPAQTYFQVLSDPELQSLANAKEVAALKATTRGTGTVTSKAYLYSAERNLIAYDVSRSQSYLSCIVASELQVRDTKTGKLAATLPLITSSDMAGLSCKSPMEGLSKSSRKTLDDRVAKRRVAIDAFLGDLGFNVTPYETAVLPRDTDPEGNPVKQKVSFPKSKMYAVVGKNGGTNILRGNTVVGTVIGEQLDYVETAKYVVGLSHNQNEGGCPNETMDSGPIK